MILEDVKTLLKIEDNTQDKMLNLIIMQTKARLQNLLGAETIPPELDYIIVEVSIVRFNRIGSEGYSRHELEGEATTIIRNDFEPYKTEIDEWIQNHKTAEENKGGFKFL